MHVPEDTPVDVTDEHNASAFRAVVADEWRTLIFSNVFHSIPARPADVEPGAPDRRPHPLEDRKTAPGHKKKIPRACGQRFGLPGYMLREPNDGRSGGQRHESPPARPGG